MPQLLLAKFWTSSAGTQNTALCQKKGTWPETMHIRVRYSVGFGVFLWPSGRPAPRRLRGVLSTPLLHALFGGDFTGPCFQAWRRPFLHIWRVADNLLLSKRPRTAGKGWYLISGMPNTVDSNTERSVTHTRTEYIDVNISFLHIFALFIWFIIYYFGGDGGDVAS
jgi:hypothetical protein